MRRAVILAAALLSGCAALDGPQRAVAADVTTTAVGFAARDVKEIGAGVPGVVARLAANEYAKTRPDEERLPIQHAIEAGGWCGAVNNLLVAAGAGAGGLAACFAVGWTVWLLGTDEREFAAMCATHRRLAGNPDLRCIYPGSPQ